MLIHNPWITPNVRVMIAALMGTKGFINGFPSVVVDMMQIKLGFEEWRKLSKEIERIAQSEELELIISMTFGFSGAEDNEEGGGETEEEEVEEAHEHHHHIVALPKEVFEELNDFMDMLKTKYNAKIDHHVHGGDHAGIVVSIMTNGKDAINVFKSIIDDAKSCENCILASVDGEFHLGNDVSVIFFGDSYKLTFILLPRMVGD